MFLYILVIPLFINLNSIRDLRLIYPDFTWGFSDHTISPLTPFLAIMEGACIIEKHFTLDQNLPDQIIGFRLIQRT